MIWMRDVLVREGQVGLLYEDGRYLRTIEPGRYRLAALPWRREEIVCVDVRRTLLPIQGQEMLTADGLSVRLNVAAEYRVQDAARAVHSATSYQMALYTSVQLVLREEVQARTLDELLADRRGLSGVLRERSQPDAEALGLELIAVGVKDVILPGEVKRLLARQLEAQREGQAALVAAREETAAVRARANTARMLAESPVLMRLRELEALTQVAEGAGNTVVVALPAEVPRPG